MAFGILYDFLMGQSIEAFKYFGAHFEKREFEKVVDVPLKKDSSKTKKLKLKKKLKVFALDFTLLWRAMLASLENLTIGIL